MHRFPLTFIGRPLKRGTKYYVFRVDFEWTSTPKGGQNPASAEKHPKWSLRAILGTKSVSERLKQCSGGSFWLLLDSVLEVKIVQRFLKHDIIFRLICGRLFPRYKSDHFVPEATRKRARQGEANKNVAFQEPRKRFRDIRRIQNQSLLCTLKILLGKCLHPVSWKNVE